MKNLVLGIDTSNYKTSVAIVDSTGAVLFDSRKFLYVKKGERGLRQSEALFQHVQQLPSAVEEALCNDEIRNSIGCVSVSASPRNAEGSYMPVFLSGVSAARCISSALNVPLCKFSHQEGHIEAIRFYTPLKEKKHFICFHFSGGTTEALLVDEKPVIVGGTKDISYGQVLDRIGVAMGLSFPCGEEMDKMTSYIKGTGDKYLSPIKVHDGYVNLSGIETQAQRLIGKVQDDILVLQLFERISESICSMTRELSEKYNVKDFIYAGGVSCSSYIRKYFNENMGNDLNLFFGAPQLSSDNAVGTALLGGKTIWR